MNDNDVNSETIWWNGGYFSQIILWKYPSEGIVITAFQRWYFYLSQNTRVRNGLISCVNAFTVCQKIVFKVTAKMLWPISLGRSGSQLFVTTKWIYIAIKSCIIKISFLLGFFFAISCGRHFENGFVGVKYGQIVIDKIMIPYNDPTRNYKLFQVSQ